MVHIAEVNSLFKSISIIKTSVFLSRIQDRAICSGCTWISSICWLRIINVKLLFVYLYKGYIVPFLFCFHKYFFHFGFWGTILLTHIPLESWWNAYEDNYRGKWSAAKTTVCRRCCAGRYDNASETHWPVLFNRRIIYWHGLYRLHA